METPESTSFAKTVGEELGRARDNPELFTLSNGHTLSYSTYGSTSPSSPTIVYFHGQPGSRLEGALWLALLKSLNIRLLAIDRPGSGSSSFQPTRTILDWPGQVAELMAHLQLAEYSILGASGGCPYALACAKLLPPTQLRRVGVVVGLGPPGLGVEDPSEGEDAAPKPVQGMPDVDLKTFDIPVVNRIFHESIRESERQGDDYLTYEKSLTTSPWGFEIEDIQLEDIRLWYGSEDSLCPPSVGKEIAKRLKNANLTVYDGEGHISLPYRYSKEILEALI